MNTVEYIASPQITLTEEQQKVYDELIKFLKNDTEQQLLLSSAAGTGKTTIITYYVNNIIKTKLCRRVVICSPTHKSLNILKSKIFETSEDLLISSNVDIMTVHRLLNYQKNIDSSGEVYYGKSGTDSNWLIYDLVIVDECSMLSKQIIDDIENEIKKPKNSKIKVIYTGDISQLPPVGESNSKIFTKKIKTLTLEKIIRTKSQSIMELSNSHRKWIASNKDKDMPYLSDYVNKNIVLHSQKSLEKWLDKFIKYLKEGDNSKDTTNNMNNNIILTWTNKKCNKYNDYIRQIMFNKKVLDKYELGEILIFNDFHRILMKTVGLDDKEQTNKIISFYTSEQIKLSSIKQDKFQFEKIKNLKNVDLPEDISTKFVKTITSINKELTSTTLNVYYMGIQKISELKNKDAPIYEVLSIHQNSEVEYNKLKDYFEDQMIKLKNSCYKIVEELKTPKNMDNSTFNMVKTDYLGIVEKKINRIWKDWQNQVIDRFAQLNYGYALTVHKSQGSTFMNVFIDIQDIYSNPTQSERLKCLYTAITRSSHSLELLV